MKQLFFFVISIALILSACTEQQNKTPAAVTENKNTSVNEPDFAGGARAANRLFPDKLRDLPNEITAAHYPNPCYAVYEDSMYIWKHNTTIQAKEDLQIVEYGSFVYTDKGWYLRITMTAKDFESSYNCKGGLLKKGVTYTDSSSWRRDQKLRGGDAMWFYIAKDKNGRLVKGMAPIETEGKLLNSSLKSASVKSYAISWTGYGEIGSYSLTGSIRLKSTDITMNDDSLETANIIFDMPTITHDDKHLEEHLKSEDFFDVAKYPVASFQTQAFIYTGDTTAIAKGMLTIKGISKPILVPIVITRAAKTQKLTGKISIDRTLYGIKYNSKNFFSGLGDKAIKNKFDLAFEMVILK